MEALPGMLQKLAVASLATYVLDGVRLALLMGAVLIPMGLWVFRLAER